MNREVGEPEYNHYAVIPVPCSTPCGSIANNNEKKNMHPHSIDFLLFYVGITIRFEYG